MHETVFEPSSNPTNPLKVFNSALFIVILLFTIGPVSLSLNFCFPTLDFKGIILLFVLHISHRFGPFKLHFQLIVESSLSLRYFV